MSESSAERARRARGYRNRNPGNINYLPSRAWRGQVALETLPNGRPGRFGVYDTHENGIRAIVMQLRRYQERGDRTITAMIARWAPPEDQNNTAAYVRFVAQRTGVNQSDPFPMHDPVKLRALVAAIIEKELGGQPYDSATIDRGVSAADDAAPSVRAAASTGTGRAAITTGGTLAAVGSAAPAVAALSGLHWAVGVAVVLAAAIGVVAYLVLKRREA